MTEEMTKENEERNFEHKIFSTLERFHINPYLITLKMTLFMMYGGKSDDLLRTWHMSFGIVLSPFIYIFRKKYLINYSTYQLKNIWFIRTVMYLWFKKAVLCVSVLHFKHGTRILWTIRLHHPRTGDCKYHGITKLAITFWLADNDVSIEQDGHTI